MFSVYFVWFDLFSNNQHNTSGRGFDWWSTTFKSAIEQFGHTVMVLSPWNDPIPLTRGWCLFELYCTSSTNSRFEVAMSESDQKMFLNDIIEKGSGVAINNMLSKVNVKRSECFLEDDKTNIFNAIRASVGFDQLNKMVFKQLSDWVIQTTNQAMMNETDEIRQLNIMNSLAELYRNQGQYNNAEPLHIACLEKRKVLLGEDHPDTLNSINSLASLYKNTGKYDKAEELYIVCLEKRRKVLLGEDHPHTLSSINNLASFYYNMRRINESKLLFKECYEKSRIALGENHSFTITAKKYM